MNKLIILLFLFTFTVMAQVKPYYDYYYDCWECPEGYNLITLMSSPPQRECWEDSVSGIPKFKSGEVWTGEIEQKTEHLLNICEEAISLLKKQVDDLRAIIQIQKFEIGYYKAIIEEDKEAFLKIKTLLELQDEFKK